MSDKRKIYENKIAEIHDESQALLEGAVKACPLAAEAFISKYDTEEWCRISTSVLMKEYLQLLTNLSKESPVGQIELLNDLKSHYREQVASSFKDVIALIAKIDLLSTFQQECEE